MRVGPEGERDASVAKDVEERWRRVELAVLAADAPGVHLGDRSRRRERVGDPFVLFSGRQPPECGSSLYQVGMCGYLEQFRVDERDESVEVRLDQFAATAFRKGGEVVGVVDVPPVEFVDAPDGVVEVGVGEERANLGLGRGVVVDFGGVEDAEVELRTQRVERLASAFVRHVEVEAVLAASLDRPVGVEHHAVVGDTDAREARVLGGGEHRPKEPAV